MKEKRIVSFFNTFIICFLIFWITLQQTILNGFDGKGRVIILLSLMLFCVNLIHNESFRRKLKLKNTSFKFWLLWFFYALINTVIQYQLNEPHTITFVGFYLVVPMVIMGVVASYHLRFVLQLLRYISITLYISFFIYLLYSDYSTRLSLKNIDPNEFSLFVFLLVFTLSVLFLFNKLKGLQYVILIVLPVLFSVVLSSRMGFVGLTLLLGGTIMVSKNPKNILSFKKVLLVAIISLLPLIYVLNSTHIGERFSSTFNQNEELENNYAKGTVFESMGDRGLYYILGWQAFLDKPIFGIGLRNFKDNYYYTVMHSEYMIQLAELGLVGFLIFLLFLRSVYKNLVEAKRNLKVNVNVYNYLLIVFVVMLLSSFVLFMYQSIYVAIIYGFLICLTSKTNLKVLFHEDFELLKKRKLL